MSRRSVEDRVLMAMRDTRDALLSLQVDDNVDEAVRLLYRASRRAARLCDELERQTASARTAGTARAAGDD